MTQEIKLPELGENVEAATVIATLVTVGDIVRADQALIEVETEKATVEVPSPVGGRVVALLVQSGQKLSVGATLLTIDIEAGGAEPEPGVSPAQGVAAVVPPATAQVALASLASATATPAPSANTAPQAVRVTPSSVNVGAAQAPAVHKRNAAEDDVEPAPAAPSVRRLARELGVDINQVAGNAPGARISMDDVKAHVRSHLQGGQSTTAAPAASSTTAPLRALPDLARHGPVEREPMNSVRRKTAEHLAHAWAVIPHVTQSDEADVSEIEQLRKRLGARVEAAGGGKLTLTAIVLKVVATALRRYPRFNAAIDVERQEIVYRKYVNIGVAVDTERGLLVPVLRDVDRKSIVIIARELGDLAERARARKIGPEELAGGGFSVTNLGGLGTTSFTPIINWPEVAVLGLGRAVPRAVWQEDAFVPRLILPLSLAYDHRLIDGADAARFLRWVAEALEQPLLLALEG